MCRRWADAAADEVLKDHTSSKKCGRERRASRDRVPHPGRCLAQHFASCRGSRGLVPRVAGHKPTSQNSDVATPRTDHSKDKPFYDLFCLTSSSTAPVRYLFNYNRMARWIRKRTSMTNSGQLPAGGRDDVRRSARAACAPRSGRAR
ncbi:hypothetical protein EVAR_60210_1 [Eumeta japonica]|uniref:Uncharacterized protein n=1 Tax=Eumeta variegata TaxID=151549 RepID=A0A4C1Z6N9_EUMVA|nr:hypothetical protein EVAR_60210_1 [Eumeta japonica]